AVVRSHALHATVSLAEAADHAVVRRIVALAGSTHGLAVHADFEPTAAIEERVHALARRPFASSVLLFDSGCAAHLRDFVAARLELFDSLSHLHDVCLIDPTSAARVFPRKRS